MPPFNITGDVITYSQVINARELCEYNEVEITLNCIGDFFYDGDVIVPVEEEFAFPMATFPGRAIRVATGCEVDMRLTPASIRLVFCAYDAMKLVDIARHRVALPPHMMIDPFSGRSVIRPNLVGRQQSGVGTVPAHLRDKLRDKQLAKMETLRYDKTKPMVLPIPPRLHETQVVSSFSEEDDRCGIADTATKCVDMYARMVQAEEHAFDPPTVQDGGVDAEDDETDCDIMSRFVDTFNCYHLPSICSSFAASTPITVSDEKSHCDEKNADKQRILEETPLLLDRDELQDDLHGHSNDSLAVTIDDKKVIHRFGDLFPPPPERSDGLRIDPSSFKWLRPPKQPKMDDRCCRSYGTPACTLECCNNNTDVGDLTNTSCQEMVVFQYIQHAAHVNQAGIREDLSHPPFNLKSGRFHNISLAERREFILAYAGSAIMATPDECEVLYEDMIGMSFAEYTHNFKPWQASLYDALDYHDARVHSYRVLREQGRVAVIQASLSLRSAVANVRTYVHPIWLNDAIIGVSFLFRGRLYLPHYIEYYRDIDIHGYTGRPYYQVGFRNVAVREFIDKTFDEGYVFCEQPSENQSVIIMVTTGLGIVPIGPFKLKFEMFWMSIEGAYLPIEWQFSPVLALDSGAILGLVDASSPLGGTATLNPCDFLLRDDIFYPE